MHSYILKRVHYIHSLFSNISNRKLAIKHEYEFSKDIKVKYKNIYNIVREGGIGGYEKIY